MVNVDLFSLSNTGTPWKTFANLFLQADIASDASGRAYAGVVDFPEGPTKITSGEFQTWLLKEDIQVKEAEALRATISMLVSDMPEQIKGKTLVCKVDNQVLKAVWERKGTSQNLMLNNIGKQIFWLQYLGQFYINLQYVRSDKMCLTNSQDSHLDWRLAFPSTFLTLCGKDGVLSNGISWHLLLQ